MSPAAPLAYAARALSDQLSPYAPQSRYSVPPQRRRRLRWAGADHAGDLR